MHRYNAARRLAALWLSLALGSACLAATAAESASPPTGDLDVAMRDCAAEQGVSTPEPGQRPDDSKHPDRKKMDACLAAKGFKSTGRGGKRPRPPEEDELW